MNIKISYDKICVNDKCRDIKKSLFFYLLKKGNVDMNYLKLNNGVEIPGENASNEWCEPVTDEEYDKLV